MIYILTTFIAVLLETEQTIDKYVAPVSVKISLSNQILYFEHTNYKKWEGKVVDILLYF